MQADTSGLRQILTGQVLPHYEESGWKLLAAAEAMWRAVDACESVAGAAVDSAATLDANSAQVVRTIARLVGEESSQQVEELQLAMLQNPLAGGTRCNYRQYSPDLLIQ